MTQWVIVWQGVDSLCLLRPSLTLITFFPLVLDVTQLLLDFLDLGRIAHIFAQVVAELDSGTAVGGGDLDNNVEGLRFLSS